MKLLTLGVTAFWIGIITSIAATAPDLLANTLRQEKEMREYDR